MKNHMKGDVMTQNIALIFGLVVIGVLVGAGVITLGSFGATTTSGIASGAVNNASLGLGNFAALLPVVGTIGAIALVVSILLSAFGINVGTRQ